jgi:hypothetical protein
LVKVADYSYGRVLLLEKIVWDEISNWPHIGTPSVTSFPSHEASGCLVEEMLNWKEK